MAFPSVTYTFVTNTDLDATQVNTNFINLIEDITKGYKELFIEDLEATNVIVNYDLSIGGNLTSSLLNANNENTFSNIITSSFISKILGMTKEDQTLSSDSFTPSKCLVELSGESDLADNLSTITGTNFSDGDLLVIYKKLSVGDITIKNGTGNIKCGSDRLLGDYSIAVFLYDGTTWDIISYSQNS